LTAKEEYYKSEGRVCAVSWSQGIYSDSGPPKKGEPLTDDLSSWREVKT
jgi:hypothetical protein